MPGLSQHQLARRTDGKAFVFAITRAVVGGAHSQLQHACGYKLANYGEDLRSLQGYLGHKNVQNAARYTELAPKRFKAFRRDERKGGLWTAILLSSPA
jgi:site-specific recombinase XerD